MTMSDKQPIHYARAASVDVVDMKFRRRVVAFVIATIVVMGIGLGWKRSWRGQTWLLGDQNSKFPVRIVSALGKIHLLGSRQALTLDMNPTERIRPRTYGSVDLGIELVRQKNLGSPKWMILIRYRTLFTLALIPWLITLIRLIRSWKRKSLLAPAPTSDL